MAAGKKGQNSETSSSFINFSWEQILLKYEKWHGLFPLIFVVKLICTYLALHKSVNMINELWTRDLPSRNCTMVQPSYIKPDARGQLNKSQGRSCLKWK